MVYKAFIIGKCTAEKEERLGIAVLMEMERAGCCWGMMSKAFIVKKSTAEREERLGMEVVMAEVKDTERRGLLLGHDI